MPDQVPAEVMSALSRLNEHARAWGCGKKAIYAYKTFIASVAATEAKPIQIGVKCHHCGGTSIYKDWDGEPRGPCYRCTRGIATLRFVESAIGDYRWHHPMADGGRDVLEAVWGIVQMRYPGDTREIAVLADGTERPLQYGDPGTWGPNQPGAERLPIEAACELLNIVERWLPDASHSRPGASWPWRRAMDELPKYRIDLERNEETECHSCRATEGLIESRMCGRQDRMTFARRACMRCHDELRWPTSPHPDCLTPAVVEWLAHPARSVPLKRERYDE